MASAGKPKSDLKRSGTRRLGDDYQDVIALDILVDWLEHSNRYRWVKVEADHFGALDDTTAELANGTLFVRQVKFSTHPEAEVDRLSWGALLKQEPGQKGSKPSLLQKWASSLALLTADGKVVDAALVSNRQASDDLRRVLRPDGTMDFDALSLDIRQEVERQLGDEARTRAFFGVFKFDLNWPNLPEFGAGVMRRFFRLGGTELGWQNLTEVVGTWVCFRDRPTPGGAITLPDIKRAAQWYQLQSLPQQFEIPSDYVLPSGEFHEDLITNRLGKSQTVTVLFASPGSGKSTYTSKLFEDLKARGTPVVRHHYFLSTTDESLAFRVDHRRAAESLMHDLLRDHNEALGDVVHHNPHPNPVELRRWLEACGTHYAAQSQSLIVILDGLDHVWRERRSVEELDRLLYLMLPLPSGVSLLVATQPVDEATLPSGLLRAAPRNSWVELPLLGPAETKAWLTYHLRDFAGFENDATVGLRVEHLADALYRRSRGHPLHLRYTLRVMLEQKLALDEEVIERLPECPHEGIVAYYKELWRVIPDEARQILHLLAATRFPWPRNNIVDCLDPEHRAAAQIFIALRQVDHLLLRTDLGLQPFHGSLLAFVSQVSEHTNWAPILKQKALHWLRGPAPDYWRWAYAWRVAADLGEDEPLLTGPDRPWTVDAISKCRPPTEVSDILGRALSSAATHHRFPRAIQLGLLKDYYAEAQEPNQAALAPMFFARLFITREPTLRNWLRAHIDELTDEQVRLLAEADARTGDPSRTLTYVDLLNERLRSNNGRQRYLDTRDEVQRVSPLLAVAALPGGPPVARIVRFAARNREQDFSVRILSIFAESLLAHRNYPGLRALLDTVPPASDGVGGVTLTPQERGAVIAHLALLALEEGTNCDDVALATPADPMLQIYAALRKTPAFRPEDIDFPPTGVLTVNEYELYRHTHETDALFTLAFLSFLANHLWDRGDRNGQWLSGVGGCPWACAFLRHLNNVARDVAVGLRAGCPPRLGEVYIWVSSFSRPGDRGNLNREEFQVGVAAATAIMAISLDLAVVLSVGVGVPTITREDLEAMFASAYCFRDSWITRYIASRRHWLTDEAVDWVLTQCEQALASSFGQFPERAERYAELAALAALHSQNARADMLLTRAAENILAHGPHKDTLFEHVLGAISAYQRERPVGERHADDDAAKWVRRLAPPIATITDFTDGDHTRQLSNSLANTIAEVSPELLPAYYQWLAEDEEYYDALYTLEVFVRTADLTDPVAQAVAQTATDDACILALADRSRGGDGRAAEALATLTAIMGQAVAAERRTEARLTTESAGLQECTQLPSIDQYPPDKLADFLAAMLSANYWRQDETLTAWAEYWADRGRGLEAYEVLMDASKRGHTSSAWDAIYRLASKYRGREDAYVSLVRAYREARGWNSYLASNERASNYLEAVRAYYPTRWADFLGDTLVRDTASQGPAVGHDAFRRLVMYCVMMGQRFLAFQLVEEMVNRSLELVSPLQLSTPGWVFPDQSA